MIEFVIKHKTKILFFLAFLAFCLLAGTVINGAGIYNVNG